MILDETEHLAWLRAQDAARRRWHQQAVAHPDPRDPDYPEDSDEGEDDEQE